MNYKMSQKLNKLIKLDIFLTRQFHIATKNFLSEYRVYFKAVKISGNGIIWLSLWIAFTWIFDNPHLVQMQVNMLLGLVIDIIATAVVKAYVQRRGPMAKPKDLLDPMSNEVFSFPSGHVSRACFVAFYFLKLWTIRFKFKLFLIIWAVGMFFSTLLLRKHFIGDALGGILLGITNGVLIGCIWVEESTAKALLRLFK